MFLETQYVIKQKKDFEDIAKNFKLFNIRFRVTRNISGRTKFRETGIPSLRQQPFHFRQKRRIRTDVENVAASVADRVEEAVDSVDGVNVIDEIDVVVIVATAAAERQDRTGASEVGRLLGEAEAGEHHARPGEINVLC